MLQNGSFSAGWETSPALPEANYLQNQRPNGWQLAWLQKGESLYDDPNSRAEGIPECVHKLSTQLPPHEQLGAPNALILDGDTTYKIFSPLFAFGAALSQTVTGLQPGTTAVLTVPIQVHMQGDSDPYSAESGVWVNGVGGWANAGMMGNRKWYKHQVEFTVPANGMAEVVVRVKSKWNKPKDFFIDGVVLKAQTAVSASPLPNPAPMPKKEAPSEPPSGKKMKRVANAESLNMRVGPSVNDAIIQELPKGTAVEVLEEGEWNRIRVGDLLGYAHSKYLAAADSPAPVAGREEPPQTDLIDLLPYVKGDGRQYELKNANGGQERLQTQEDAANFYQMKNTQWEQFFCDDDFIYRDVDISPGNNRYYRLKDADLPRGSRWLRRRMAVGQTHRQSLNVQFYQKQDGSTSAPNSGDVTNTIKLVAHHKKYRFRTGIELDDVIQLEWVNGGETYFYGRGFGLVGWERTHQDPHTPAWSAISEIHPAGSREPFKREAVSLR